MKPDCTFDLAAALTAKADTTIHLDANAQRNDSL